MSVERDLTQSLFYEWESGSEEFLSPQRSNSRFPQHSDQLLSFSHTPGWESYNLLPSSVGGQFVLHFQAILSERKFHFLLVSNLTVITLRMDPKWTSKCSHIARSRSFNYSF